MRRRRRRPPLFPPGLHEHSLCCCRGEELRKRHERFWLSYVKYMKQQALGEAVDDSDEATLFRQCEEEERRNQQLLDRSRARRVDPTVDLVADKGDGFSVGYGLAPESRRLGADLAGAKGARGIIRELNRHAAAAVDGLPTKVG